MANEVRVLVKADTKDAVHDLKKVGDAANVAGMALVGMGVAAAGGLAISVNAAANFEHAIDQVGAVSNATEKEMAGLADTALRIGKDTAFSATEAAAAMEILAANGVSVSDIMNGAADATVALAAAGGTDLQTAADVASTSMAVWSLKASDMTDVVNRLAGAANVSRFSVEDMAGAIAMGGGAARVSGVEFGDFAAAIAAIAPNFSSGSDAGTSFKQFLAGLTPETKSAKKAFAELGLTAADGSNKFYDAAGNLKSMADIVGLLNTATAGLSEQQKSQALTTIFGSDAMRAAAGISALTREEFEKLSATMGDTSAADVAAQRMGNFRGSMEALNGSLEVIQIEIGTKLLPVLTKLADWAATTLPVAFAYVETEMAPKVKSAFAEVSAAAGVFAADVRPHLVAFADEAKRQFSKFQIYYESDLKPAFENIQTAVRYVVQVFQENWPKIEPLVMTVVGAVANLTAMVRDSVALIVDLIQGDWAGAWENAKQIVMGAVDGVIAYFTIQWELLRLNIAILATIGEDMMTGLLDGLNAGGKAVWEWLRDLGPSMVRFVGDLSRTLFQAGWNLVSGFFSGITDKFNDGIGAITSKLDPRNWDIPGLSPLPDAMVHAGQIAGGLFGSSFTQSTSTSTAEGTPSMAEALRRAVRDAIAAALAELRANFNPFGVGVMNGGGSGSSGGGSPAGGGGGPQIGDMNNGLQYQYMWNPVQGAWQPGWGYPGAGSTSPGGGGGETPSTPPGIDPTTGTGGGTTINLVVDGQVLASVITNHLARAM